MRAMATGLRNRFSFGEELELAPQIQGDHQEVANAASEAIPQAIFGDTSGSRMVAHGHFLHLSTPFGRQDWHEAMDAVERR